MNIDITKLPNKLTFIKAADAQSTHQLSHNGVIASTECAEHLQDVTRVFASPLGFICASAERFCPELEDDYEIYTELFPQDLKSGKSEMAQAIQYLGDKLTVGKLLQNRTYAPFALWAEEALTFIANKCTKQDCGSHLLCVLHSVFPFVLAYELMNLLTEKPYLATTIKGEEAQQCDRVTFDFRVRRNPTVSLEKHRASLIV